jgi:hypothetical protein
MFYLLLTDAGIRRVGRTAASRRPDMGRDFTICLPFLNQNYGNAVQSVLTIIVSSPGPAHDIPRKEFR